MTADELTEVSADLWLPQENPEFPEGFVDWDEERRNAWWYAFYETEAGRRYLEAGASYAVEIGPDGSFRLDDVPAGEYRLECVYTKTTGGFDQPQETRRVAELNLDVEIPAEPAGEPFDLGTLKLQKPMVDR